MKPIDARRKVRSDEFAATSSSMWETPWIVADFPFDELIYYWNARLERREGFRVYLQVMFGEHDESPWLYGGFWGKVKPIAGERQKPEFDRGHVDEDWLLLKQKAKAWRFRIASEGDRPLMGPPSMGVVTTDNHPTQDVAEKWDHPHNGAAIPPILDIPHRKQQDVAGNRLKDRCQSAALASAMQYFGTTVPLEQIIALTTDPEYKSFGIWPRTINAAYEFGFDAYLDRFRDWESVARTVAENKVILCSIKMPKDDNYIAPPYGSIGGHIVALNGMTTDGRIVVTDSTMAVGDSGYLLQWKREDFEKIWMRNKGGVGMVICPPKGAARKVISSLPAFPDRSTSDTTSVKAE